MKKTEKMRRRFGGFTALLALVLAAAIGCSMLAWDWALLIDLRLGTSSTGRMTGTVDENSVYFKSSYGDISALFLDPSERTEGQQQALLNQQQALMEDEKAFATREAEEGNVLLCNKDMALPLATGSRVSLFGMAAGNPVYRSSSGGASAVIPGRTISLAQALRDDGFILNEPLQTALESADSSIRVSSPTNGRSSIGELDTGFYESFQASFADYGDAAIVVFARTGGEGIDLNTTDAEGISQLALHDNEKALLRMIKDSGAFAKTIVLIDSGYPMEMGWLTDEEYGVDACLWIGNPGMYGFAGVANLLCGKANPSGRLVDTWAENSLSSPAVINFGDMSYANNTNYKYVVAAEGIYVGYKFYETRYEDAVLARGNADAAAGSIDGEAWNYAKEVTFPFGYGLSYTTFSQKIDRVEYDAQSDCYNVYVTVENTGNVAGKSVVQIYAQTPWVEGVAETEAIRLVGFNKTLGKKADGKPETEALTDRESGMLLPGDKESVCVPVSRYYLTSYSETARGGQGGYVLTGGDYYLAVGDNAHDALNSILAFKGAEGLYDENGDAFVPDASRVHLLGHWNYDETAFAASVYTGEEVHNQLKGMDANDWQSGAVTYLSRSDWQGTWPVRVELTLTDDMKNEMDGGNYQASENATPKGTYEQGESADISFIDMKDIPFSGKYKDIYGVEQDADEKWEAFLNQINKADLIANTTNGSAAVTSIAAPRAGHGDGPDGIQGTMDNGQPMTCYNAEIVAASTWNPKMLRMRGDFQAEDGLYAKHTVVWGPGANLHRTPFSGRNFEYYSECGYFSGLCCYYQVSAMVDKGLVTCIKHFVGNDQETNRTGVATFRTEQAWREGPLKAFEGGIARGKSLGVMTSFSLIGCTPAPSCYATNVQILEKEWGFTGLNITDSSYQMKYMDSVDCIMNGTTTFCLDNRESDLKKREARSKYDDILGGLRRANKGFYYALSRSNATNGIASDTVISTSNSWWKTTIIAIDAVMAAATLVCLCGWIICELKSRKKGAVEHD